MIDGSDDGSDNVPQTVSTVFSAKVEFGDVFDIWGTDDGRWMLAIEPAFPETDGRATILNRSEMEDVAAAIQRVLDNQGV